MMAGVRIIRKRDLATTEWSGGRMTELFIFPQNAKFADRNFLFNIVSATIDVEESTFSDLTGFTRVIMTLDHDLELRHGGAEKIILTQYEPYVFDGGAATVSRGRVTDYNFVMKTGVCRGDTLAASLPSGGTLYPRRGAGPNGRHWELVYCARGEFRFQGGDRLTVGAGDLLVLEPDRLAGRYRYTNEGHGPCDLIISTAFIGD